MLGHRDQAPNLRQSSGVDFRHKNADVVFGPRDNLPPRIAHHGMTEGPAELSVRHRIASALSAGREIGLEFDRACPTQHLPMSLPGLVSESGGQDEDIDLFLREAVEQPRKRRS